MTQNFEIKQESAGPYELFALAVVAPVIFPLSGAFAAVSYALIVTGKLTTHHPKA